MNLEIYKPELREKRMSMIGGKREGEILHTNTIFKEPVLAAFLEDNDLQEITIASSCIGFVYTFTKQYANVSPKPPLGPIRKRPLFEE